MISTIGQYFPFLAIAAAVVFALVVGVVAATDRDIKA